MITQSAQVSVEQSNWINNPDSPDELIQTFGGNYAAHAFADAQDTDALPLIIPAYNAPGIDPTHLYRTLSSLAVASNEGRQRVRPLIVVNGEERGPVPEIAKSFSLKEGTQFIQIHDTGKTRAFLAGVSLLLEREGYVGPFATADDDVVFSPEWPATVMGYMSSATNDAVSGGTVRYHQVAGVSRRIIGARNSANAFKERQAAKRGDLRAHGSNMWFNAAGEGKITSAISEVDPDLGYGDDTAIVQAIKKLGGLVMPINLNPSGQLATAGDRSKSWTDLAITFFGKGGARYKNDKAWDRSSET